MKKNKTIEKFMQNKRFSMVLSLVLAVITWMLVTRYIDPSRTDVIDKVPVDFEYNAATYQSLGLEILNKEQIYVKVDIAGDGYVLSGLSAKDITVHPMYDEQVRGPGTYELELTYKRKNNKAYEVTSISPRYVTVQFDKVIDKKMPITVNATNLEIAEGYYLDTPVASPAEVNLYGPESAINKVAKVVANVSVAEKRKDSVVVPANLELQDKDGNVLSLTDNYITMDVDKVEVRLNILEEREIPITVEYTNVPYGFDTSILKMELSQDTLRVAASTAQWENFQSFNVGYIDLSTFQMDKEYQFSVKLPDGFINRENLLNLTATFDNSHLKTKTVTVTDVRSSGALPKGLKLTVPTNASIGNVQLIGPEKVLEDITASNVIAQINASELPQISGKQDVPVHIIIPGSSQVFAIGSYKIVCRTTVE